ncbi:beta-phosphoglucomutase family hydrolase [Arthrobacter sp. VKM Ac-2550]|uniref:beta-phosphoglucomutase family hydrolase n=1 Tax=Crystallibacter permensis TaxID=1938888 RepID=UPI002225E5C5|nr:beta-phosphoglucomutase family hydrolase [Arthrobacter sp. VKM Ac-2550]MCW2134183.1 haloacid dehalogenase superfamily, subfamily IA, variant 3 with third motif having DD or ED/beta-phosphoglucomutase family hydrolase [Arthrobacter sp. VKM Ac-2550]
MSPVHPGGLHPSQASGHRTLLPFDAVLFDMDGVVTRTAVVHAAAWKELFDSVLADPRSGTGADTPPFDADADYRLYVDGRKREDGIRAFLASRGLHLSEGSPGDRPEAWTVAGLGSRKNDLFLTALARDGVSAYPGTVALLERLREAGIPVGLVTASRNAAALLKAAGLEPAFDVIIDGQTAEDQGLPGKPDPAMFLEAARRLGVPPERAAVIEDAVSGVQAGRRGGFGLVVGIDRTGHREQLELAGADVVLGDVGQLDLGASRTDPWTLVYEGFDPAHEGHREALTALGNGYMATRGARPERNDDGTHYPGTYLAGVYNRTAGIIHGRELEEEHLVNVPNWLPVDVRIGDGPWWSTGDLDVTEERSELDLRRGVLTRRATLTGPEGGQLSVVQRRLVSMHRHHLAALETTLTARGFTGTLSVQAGIDAQVANTNVRAYVGTGQGHLADATFTETDSSTVLCEVETTQSRIRIALAVRTGFNGAAAVTSRGAENGNARYRRQFDLRLADGQPVTMTRTVALATSRDHAISAPAAGALAELARHDTGFGVLLEDHEAAWRRLWDRFGIDLDADRQSQLVLNLHVFHLLQAISGHSAVLDAGVPARGLHGEGYRGHVFWDELFVLPVIGLRLPEVSRALLEYRWRRLDAARAAARTEGLNGALFPWQSGSDGREETPRQLYNPRSARWMPDNSSRQRHVGLAVAYNAWQHFQATGDRDWLASRGAELIIEVTRMFASLATFDPAGDRYHIAGVMGPDEYHDGYPDAPGTGLRDNAYTNVLLSWLCDRAADVLRELAGHPGDDVADRLHISPEEISRWSRLGSRLAVAFHADGVISQFDGYEDLLELDWPRYRARYGNIGRLDLILEAENDDTNRYKLAKQADVLMLLYLLGPAGVTGQLRRLGYPVTEEDLERTVNYYLSRTAEGSTLSRVVHASVLSRFDASRAWQVFREALIADLDDTQGGTTREGIHLGAMSGTVDIVIRSFAGLQIEADALTFAPRLPAHLGTTGFQFQYRGHRIDVHLGPEHLRIRLQPCTAPPVRIGVAGNYALLAGGDEKTFPVASTPGLSGPAPTTKPTTQPQSGRTSP